MGKHKCEGCTFKGEHKEMGFMPFGVYKLESNLIEAEKNYNAEKCPYRRTITNADAIRNMTDTELAEFLKNFWNKTLCDYCTKFIEDRPCNHECEKGFLEWLQTEVKEEK